MTDSPDYTAAIRAAAAIFQAEVNRLSEEEVLSWRNGRQMLDIARALCDASSGFAVGSATRITFGLPGQAHLLDVKKTIAMQYQIRPAWWHYLKEAFTVIEYLGGDVPTERAVSLVTELQE